MKWQLNFSKEFKFYCITMETKEFHRNFLKAIAFVHKNCKNSLITYFVSKHIIPRNANN